MSAIAYPPLDEVSGLHSEVFDPERIAYTFERLAVGADAAGRPLEAHGAATIAVALRSGVDFDATGPAFGLISVMQRFLSSEGEDADVRRLLRASPDGWLRLELGVEDGKFTWNASEGTWTSFATALAEVGRNGAAATGRPHWWDPDWERQGAEGTLAERTK